MPDSLFGSRGFQLADSVSWKWEAFSKNNANYDSGSVLLFGWVRLGAAILHNNVMTAVGVAVGDGRHYNTYYVNIAWEWFRGREKQLLFFGLGVSG